VKIVGAMPWSRVARGVTTTDASVTVVTADSALAADIDAACRLSGTFTLRSGQVSHEYFDKYLFETTPALLARVAEAMVELVPRGTELLGGLEMGGIPIATVLSARTGLPALFVRKQAKDYGTCKLAEGPDVAGRRVTLVEDVITTGGAVRDATNALREAGAIVDVVICAIDRSPEGENPLADVGLEVRPVLTKAELDAVRASAERGWADSP
jgi:orotate phosphoribosyltransferase